VSIYRPLKFPAAATAPAPYPSTIIQFAILANGFKLPGQSKLKILKIINKKNWSKIVVVQGPIERSCICVRKSWARATRTEPEPGPVRFGMCAHMWGVWHGPTIHNNSQRRS